MVDVFQFFSFIKDESTSRRVETGEGASEPIEQSRSSLKVGFEKTGKLTLFRFLTLL